MENFLAASASSAVLVSVLLQQLKNTPLFPWLDRNTGKLNATVSVVLAAITAVGISYTFDYDQKTGVFALAFKGTAVDFFKGLAHVAGQWSIQHAAYKGLLVPAEILGEIRAMVTVPGRVSPKPGTMTETKI